MHAVAAPSVAPPLIADEPHGLIIGLICSPREETTCLRAGQDRRRSACRSRSAARYFSRASTAFPSGVRPICHAVAPPRDGPLRSKECRRTPARPRPRDPHRLASEARESRASPHLAATRARVDDWQRETQPFSLLHKRGNSR